MASTIANLLGSNINALLRSKSAYSASASKFPLDKCTNECHICLFTSRAHVEANRNSSKITQNATWAASQAVSPANLSFWNHMMVTNANSNKEDICGHTLKRKIYFSALEQALNSVHFSGCEFSSWDIFADITMCSMKKHNKAHCLYSEAH